MIPVFLALVCLFGLGYIKGREGLIIPYLGLVPEFCILLFCALTIISGFPMFGVSVFVLGVVAGRLGDRLISWNEIKHPSILLQRLNPMATCPLDDNLRCGHSPSGCVGSYYKAQCVHNETYHDDLLANCPRTFQYADDDKIFWHYCDHGQNQSSVCKKFYRHLAAQKPDKYSELEISDDDM